MSHYQTAVEKVRQAIAQGRILKADNVLDRELTTVGACHLAVDTGIRFTVIGWKGRRPQRDTTTALEAAQTFVDRVGSTRAREAAGKRI